MNTKSDDYIKNYVNIESEQLPRFIRENFGKIRGTLSCTNPHWWLHFGDVYIAYEYQCCDSADCNSQDYIVYTDPELLISENYTILTDYGDWWWKNEI